MKNPGRVKSIYIEKLFGLYDHRIDLKEERVTILHGPNGVGKTTLLRLVDGVLSGNFEVCEDVPFLNLEIGFENGVLSLRREGIGEPRWRKEDRPIVMRWDGEENHWFGPGKPNAISDFSGFGLLRDALASLVRKENGWFWPSQNTHLSDDQVRTSWQQYYQIAEKNTKWEAPVWFEPQRVRIIHTDRLFTFEEPDWKQRQKVSPAVETCATRMKVTLDTHLANYATESEQLERSLPFRLADGARKLLTLSEISAELEQLNQARRRLQDLDLLDDDAAPPYDPASVADMDPVAQAVMSLYVRDVARKLDILSDIAHRLEIFREGINNKFLNKQVQISREIGLRILSVDGEILALSELSSGEQHELVLLFDLLFQTPANTLVLIDEPELSMHPSWKRNFLRDVLEVAAVARIDVVLATHSVQIVNGRHDLMVALAGDQH